MAVQPTLVVCSDNPAAVDRDFFFSLEAKIMFLETPAVLMNFLRQARPHGVCLVMSPSTFVSKPAWFHDVERRCYFEGLRVVVFLRMAGSPISLNDILGSERAESLRVRLAPLLAMRDVVILASSTSQAERDGVRQRVRLSLGLGSSEKFDERFPILLRKGGTVKVTLPGRVSWFDDDGMMNIETSVRLKGKTGCKVRFIESSSSLLTLDAVCVEGTQTGLRFNYGSAVKLAFGELETAQLRRYFVTESPRFLNKTHSFLRALTVVRTPAIREKIVQLLHNNMVEFRVPLVWRNVRHDIPRLAPHYIILEDTILSAQTSKPHTVIEELRGIAGPQTKICLIGPAAQAYADELTDPNLFVFSSAGELDLSFRAFLAEPVSIGVAEDESSRTWLSADAPMAECTIEVEEKFVMAGSAGIVVESPHTYRSLSNVFMNFGNSQARILSKNIGSYLSTDVWKLSRKGGKPGDVDLSQFHFLFGTGAEEYLRDFDLSLQAECMAFRERMGRWHKKLDDLDSALRIGAKATDDPREKQEREKDGKEFVIPTVGRKPVHRKRHHGIDEPPREPVQLSYEQKVALDAERAEARRQREERRKNKLKRELIILLIIVIVLSGGISLLLWLNPSTDSVFVDSFSDLFKRYGRTGE